jgi:hypothetical protein
MRKIGGFGILFIGGSLVIVGWLVQSNLLEWLLDVIGVIIIVTGVILGIVGIVKMFSGGDGGSSDF